MDWRPAPANHNPHPLYLDSLIGRRVQDFEPKPGLLAQLFTLLWKTITFPFRAIYTIVATMIRFVISIYNFVSISLSLALEIFLEILFTMIETGNGFRILALGTWYIVFQTTKILWNIVAFFWSTIILGPFRIAYFLVENRFWHFWYIVRWFWYSAVIYLMMCVAVLCYEILFREWQRTKAWWRWRKSEWRKSIIKLPTHPSPIVQRPMAVYTYVSDLYSTTHDFFEDDNWFWDMRDDFLLRHLGIRNIIKPRTRVVVCLAVLTIVYFVSTTFSPPLVPYERRILRQGFLSFPENFARARLERARPDNSPWFGTPREATYENYLESIAADMEVVTPMFSEVVNQITQGFEVEEQSQKLEAQSTKKGLWSIVVPRWVHSLGRFEEVDNRPSFAKGTSTTEASGKVVEANDMSGTANIIEEESPGQTGVVRLVVESKTSSIAETVTEYIFRTITLPAETIVVTECIAETTTLPAKMGHGMENDTDMPRQTVYSLLDIGRPDTLHSEPANEPVNERADFWDLPDFKTNKRRSMGGGRSGWCSSCQQFHCCELPY